MKDIVSKINESLNKFSNNKNDILNGIKNYVEEDLDSTVKHWNSRADMMNDLRDYDDYFFNNLDDKIIDILIDKDKKYINLNISSNEDKRALVEYIVSIDKEVTKLIKTIIREFKKDMTGYFQRRRYD